MPAGMARQWTWTRVWRGDGVMGRQRRHEGWEEETEDRAWRPHKQELRTQHRWNRHGVKWYRWWEMRGEMCRRDDEWRTSVRRRKL
jgi:hypothetical protein